MKLAKNHVDVAVMTNRLEPMLTFWQDEVGLRYCPSPRGTASTATQ